MKTDDAIHNDGSGKHIAIVLKGYPRLSETFIAQEIHALERSGFIVQIVSLRHPYDPDTHPVHAQIEAPVLYLPEYVYQEPLRCIRALSNCVRRPALRRAFGIWWQDFKRDTTFNRARRFVQALVLTNEVDAKVKLLYAHFLHTPASVTRYASELTGLPWSCSAHAKDIWTIDSWEKSEKLTSCQWLVTCTQANFEHLTGLIDSVSKVRLLYHGLDFERIENVSRDYSNRNGTDSEPVKLMSVGRAVSKKGYEILLQALAALPSSINWQFIHIGGGANLAELKKLSITLNIAPRIQWMGAVNQKTVFTQYQNSDLFVLTSRIADDGDRDGLPNVLMEAQSQGLACLATNVSGIPELIHHGETGWLIDPNNIDQTTEALKKLIQSPELRETLGQAGEKRVRGVFSMHDGIALLVELLNETITQEQCDSVPKT